MEARDRIANLGLLAAAGVAWVLVALLVTTRDPYADPMAGYLGALLIGLAVGPHRHARSRWLVVFARHRRIAYQGDWLRAARRGAWIGLFVTVLVDPAPRGRVPAAHRPVPRRHLRRGRDHPLGRALGAPMTESPIAARPAEPFADVKARAAAAVEAARDEILDLSHRIHANPEPAFEEHQAAAWCRGGRRPPRVRRGASRSGSLATAVRGRITGGLGADGPRIGILAEYDALPGLGHGCGHNTMAASGVGAAIALAAVRDDWAGEVVFLGTPAEERGSGKEIMLRDGLFDGLDAALLYHPCDRNHVESAPLASEDVVVVFKGLQRTPRPSRGRGKNALDAMIALFVSVGLWRQQLPPHCRVHGIIQEGGTAANIIPDRTRAWFMIRSADQRFYDEVMKPRFRQLCEAAALAAGVEVEVEFSGYASTMKHNRVARGPLGRQRGGVRDRATRAWTRRRAPRTWPTSRGSIPAIHPDLAITDVPTPGHTTSSATPPAGPRADRTVLLAATLVAQTALDLLLDPSLVDAAWREFRGRGIARPAPRRRGRATMPPCAPRRTADPNRRRPAGRHPPAPATAGDRLRRTRGRASPRPGRRRLRSAQRLGPRVRGVRRLRPAHVRRAADVHEAALGAGRGRPPGAQRGRRDRRRPVRRRRQPPARRPLRPARDPRGPVHDRLHPLAPAGRRAVRDPRRRRRRRREHHPGLDRARPRASSTARSTRWRRPVPSRSSSAATTRSPGRRPPPSPTSAGPGCIGIVHFDAHADTANDDWGVLAGHGTPMRRLIESGAVKGRNFVQVGLRGYWPPVETFEWMKEHELRWHLMREVEERGAEAVIDDAIAEALDGPDAVYISVDIDVIDPGIGARHRHPGARRLPAARAAAGGPPDRGRGGDRGHGHRRGVAAVRPRRGDRDGRQPRRPGGASPRSPPSAWPATPSASSRTA